MYSVSDTSKRWVSPFGHPRIKACLTAPRGLSWPTTSFIASSCQGIHHVRFVAWPYNHGLVTTWLEVKRENQHRSLYEPRSRSHEKLMQLVTTSFVQIMHLYNLISIDYKCRSRYEDYSIHTFVFGMVSRLPAIITNADSQDTLQTYICLHSPNC